MKKAIVGLLVFGFIFAFAACNSNASSGKNHVGQSVALWESPLEIGIGSYEVVAIRSQEELGLFINEHSKTEYPKNLEVVNSFNHAVSNFDFMTQELVLCNIYHSSSLAELSLVQTAVEDGTLVLSFESASPNWGTDDFVVTTRAVGILKGAGVIQTRTEVQNVWGYKVDGCWAANGRTTELKGYEEWKSLAR